MPFTCKNVLDKVERVIPDIYNTLSEFIKTRPWAESFVRRFQDFLRNPSEEVYLACSEYMVGIGSEEAIRAAIDGVTVETKQGCPTIIFFGGILALYDRYWFTRYEGEVDAYLRTVAAHELMHAFLFKYREFGEEIPEKVEEMLSEVNPFMFLTRRAMQGWVTEAVKLAYNRGHLKLFPTDYDALEWLEKSVSSFEVREYRPPPSLSSVPHSSQASVPLSAVSPAEQVQGTGKGRGERMESFKSDIAKYREHENYEVSGLLDYVLSVAQAGKGMSPDIENKIDELRRLGYPRADELRTLFS